MCAQLGLAHVQGCSGARWEGVEVEAWPYWVDEGRGQSCGLGLLAETSGSQTVLILGASAVRADFLSPMKARSPSVLMEEWHPCRQRPETAVRAPPLLPLEFSRGSSPRELRMAQEGLWGWYPYPHTSLSLRYVYLAPSFPQLRSLSALGLWSYICRATFPCYR